MEDRFFKQGNVVWYGYVLISGLILVLTSFELFSDGMFLDGLWYASISRNMAEGLGTFWKPHFTETLYPEFYEHPPLALGMQALWYKVLGDSLYVERWYSLATYIVVAALMLGSWKEIKGSFKLGWVPLLLWIIAGGVAWSAANNMLENTMAIFVCGSLWLLIKWTKKRSVIFLVLAGVFLSAGFLVKGPFCLYLWTFPFYYGLLKNRKLTVSVMSDTVVYMLFTILPILLLCVLIPAARENLSAYYHIQVKNSLLNIQTVDSRFSIIGMFLKDAAIPILLVLLISVVRRKSGEVIKRRWNLLPITLLLVVISGVLPIMISLKQSGFYVLTVYPLLAMALSIVVYDHVDGIINLIASRKTGRLVFIALSLIMLVAGIGLSYRNAGHVLRDQEMIVESRKIIAVVGKDTTLSICPEMYENWSLHGYFSRHGNVSLDKDIGVKHTYLITSGRCPAHFNTQGYDEVKIGLNRYRLYRLR